MRALVDLTTIPNGHEQKRLESFLEAHPTLDPTDVTVVAPSDNVDPPTGSTFVSADGNPGERWSALTSALSEFSTTGGPGDVVASFQNDVMKIIESQDKVGFFDLRDLLKKPSAPEIWPETFYPLKNALEVLRKAVIKRGGTVRMTSLRPAMSIEDPRFKKNASDPTPLDQQFIVKLLIREAVSKGLVKLVGPSDNPFIELMAETAVPPEAAPTQTYVRESDRFISILREAGMGPFQQVRWAIYDAIDESLTNNSTPTIDSLLNIAVSQVRSDIEVAAAEGKIYLVKPGQRLPWSQVRGFVSFS